jgi:hypothetical protein
VSGGEPVAALFADRRLVAAYEELRSQALGGWQRGPGFALMLTRGFRCWMDACRQLLDTASIRLQAPDRPESLLPTGLRSEVVILLAGMLIHKASKGVA